MLSEEQKCAMKLDIIILQNIANDCNYSLEDRKSALRQAQKMIAIIYNYFPENGEKDTIIR